MEPKATRRTPLEALAAEIGGHTAKIESGLMSLIVMLEGRVAELEGRIADLETPAAGLPGQAPEQGD